jgi:pentatricopeptide repeat protein
MQERKQDISVDTYNSIIHTCTQAGEMARAEKYLEYMEECGLEPNMVSYNSVINACADQGDAVRAERWLLRMVARGLKPNVVTYGTICKVFARQGAVQQIESIMKLLEDGGTPLNEYFYASLISACGACTPPDPVRAEKALTDLVQGGLRPHSVKRALARVVGDRRTAQLLEHFSRTGAGAGAIPPGSPSAQLFSCSVAELSGFQTDMGQAMLLPPFPMDALSLRQPGGIAAFAPVDSPMRTAPQVPLGMSTPPTTVPMPGAPAMLPTPSGGCSAAEPPSSPYVRYVPGATLRHFSHLVTAAS